MEAADKEESSSQVASPAAPAPPAADTSEPTDAAATTPRKADDADASSSASPPPPAESSPATSSPRVQQHTSGAGLPLGAQASQRRASSSHNGKGVPSSAATSEAGAGLPPVHRAQSSNLANKIAAFSSGVAPLRKGIPNVDEDAITMEEVLHKLETAGRLTGQEKCELPVPLLRSAHLHLVAAREEAARTAKELAELKASRVQHIPPSTWIKREQKYKQDQEKHEHQVGQLRARIEGLERELGVLRDGSNVQPLEEKIKELEHQLVAAAEEKTKVQSKFHELSIKHRQLIETSPQVATIWNEVLVQQAADGHNAAAMQRLVNFDLRHTAASPSSGMPVVSSQPLPGVSAAAAVYDNGGPVPVPAAPHYGYGAPSSSSTEQPGPSTPMQQPQAGSPGPSGQQQQQPRPPQTAEERAHALMEAVALEGLSPEASLAALQQLNADLTMQLGCYQQMVLRLKDAMEASDLEKAELEAEKMALEMQLHAGAGGGGAGEHHHSHNQRSSSQRGGGGGWGGGLGFWRRSVGMSAGGPGGMDDLDETGSMADGASSMAGPGSISSSRRSSMDLDGAASGLAGAGGSGSIIGTPTRAAADAAAGASADGGGGGSEDGSMQHHQQHHDQQAKASAGGGGGGGLFAARRQRAAARAAAAADALAKEGKELKRQVKSLQDENKYLVNALVEIKMELAETQGNHDQAKRALVRAMDKEACLDMQVSELRHMLDMSTSLNEQYEQQAGSSSMASAGAAVAAAAGGLMAAAAKAVASSTPNSAKAAMAALQSPFGRPEPDAAGAGDATGSSSADAEGSQQQQQQQPSDGEAPVASFQLPAEASLDDDDADEAQGGTVDAAAAAADSSDAPPAAAEAEQPPAVAAAGEGDGDAAAAKQEEEQPAVAS